ncbi:MAG TPA: toll/interleukin-1 receptor domain-containing protein [Terracidiphilus sp.]|nr:toll/interleukin-1 receptor domain-containing protein [Terracidiphilus sp.]
MPNQDVWRQIDHVLLNAKLAEIAEKMHPKLAEDKAIAHSEGHKRGNSAFYPAERVRFEERRADEWAEKEYEAACKVWETQGHKPSRAFYRAVYENLLAPLFATRKATVIADMGLEDRRTGRSGHSAGAQGAFAQSMGKLSSRWNRKIEVATREYEYSIQREQKEGVNAGPSSPSRGIIRKKWDVFICHASEDKDEIARPLAQALIHEGYSVWYDEFTLTAGDSIRKSIDLGLAQSDFGVVILSKHFFEKHWPQQELNGLASKEIDGRKVILPLWHGVAVEGIRSLSPMLADRIGVPTNKGLEYVVEQLELAMK